MRSQHDRNMTMRVSQGARRKVGKIHRRSTPRTGAAVHGAISQATRRADPCEPLMRNATARGEAERAARGRARPPDARRRRGKRKGKGSPKVNPARRGPNANTGGNRRVGRRGPHPACRRPSTAGATIPRGASERVGGPVPGEETVQLVLKSSGCLLRAVAAQLATNRDRRL